MNMRKVGVLYQKDLKDFIKNPGVSLGALMPIVFVVIYKAIGLAAEAGPEMASYFLLNMGTVMSISMVALLVISASVAEEKEKFTLRTLMLSNVNGTEFLMSKVFVTLTVSIVDYIVIFLVSESPLANFPIYLLCCVLGSVSLMMLSAWIGIVARDQNSTSLYQIPIMLFMMLPAMLKGFNEMLTFIAEMTPISALMTVYGNYAMGQFACADTWKALAVMVAWMVIGVVLFVWGYRKKGIDN